MKSQVEAAVYQSQYPVQDVADGCLVEALNICDSNRRIQIRNICRLGRSHFPSYCGIQRRRVEEGGREGEISSWR